MQVGSFSMGGNASFGIDAPGIAGGRFLVNSTGSIGIGTNSPSAKLHVSANNQNGVFIDHISTADYGYALLVKVNRDVTKAFTIEDSRTGTEVFKVWGNGVVNTNYIYAKKIKVVLDPFSFTWPDYVFDSNHELKSLSEIESYIKTNKHLEDVPSAAEVKENGIDVGEMNTILLKKIEEMTLLMIEQNKAIETLKTKVAELMIK